MSAFGLEAVDDLCRLVIAARRLGCELHLVDVDNDLRALLELAGVGDVVGRCPADERRAAAATAGDIP